MTRAGRFGLLGLAGGVLLLGAGLAYVYGSARTTLDRARARYADFEAEERRVARGRPPWLASTEVGDAQTAYGSLEAASRARDPDALDWQTLERIVRLPLALRPGESFALERPASFAWAMRLQLPQHPASDEDLARLRSLLVLALDGMEFGRPQEWEDAAGDADAALAGILEACAAGRPGAVALATTARLFDAVEARPPSSRGARFRTALAVAAAAGEHTRTESSRSRYSIHRISLPEAKPGAGWLWSETVARADAVNGLREVGARLVAAWEGPPTCLREASKAQGVPASDGDYRWFQWYFEGRFAGGTTSQGREPWCFAPWLDGLCLWRERLAVARAAVAVARHRHDHGVLPRTLADLVPDYLAAMPLDPTTGAALIWEGQRLRAVGPDGDDDGGRPLVDWLGLSLVELSFSDLLTHPNLLDGDVVWAPNDVESPIPPAPR